MLLLLAALSQAATTTDTIDETEESDVADNPTCFRGGPYSMTELEAEAVFEFTFGTEELGDLKGIDIQVRGYRQNCRVEIDEFEIYLDSTSLYKDDTLALVSEGDGSASSPDWRLDQSYIVSDIKDLIVAPGAHEIRAVVRGAGDNENNKIEITITADWEHGFDWDSDSYTDDRLSGGDDCNDRDASINPGVEETWYDGIDQNCDTLSDFDQDGDLFESADETEEGTDCDDTVAEINPDATEVWYDGVDQDCDTWSDYDQDFDGFDSRDETDEGQDCDDLVAEINPDADEIWYDGIDQDCDDWSDYDQDFDGYERVEDGGTDCDDLDETVNVDATEVWYDGVDQDCDGWSDYDQDRDGFDSPDHGGDDCDDLDATAFPDARDWTPDCQRTVKDDGTRLPPEVVPPGPTGCDCDSGAGGAGWAWMGLVGLLLGLRRRR